jgi:quinol monooxygenase YgiN
MSVIVMMRMHGDPERIEAWSQANKQVALGIAEDSKRAGCIHHLFAAEGDEVVGINEWPDEQAFHTFFDSQPDIPKVMEAVGVQGEPEITVLRKMDTPDQF